MHASVINLQHLVRLGFINKAVWLNGYPKEDVAIQWVSLSIDEVGSGDVLLIHGEQLTNDIVDQFRAHRGAAIISWGEFDIPDQKLLFNIPVVVIPKDQEFREVYRTLLTILINQRAYLMERGVRIHAQLSQLEAEGKGMVGLVITMSEISGRSVLVQDKRLRIIAECASSTLRSIWDDVLEYLIKPKNLPEILRDRERAESRGLIVSQLIPGDLARIIIPIVVGGVARGYISLIGLEGEFDALDNLVLEQGALVCGVDMARAKAVREAEKRIKGDLLTAILYESLTPRDAYLWIQSIGLNLNFNHVTLRFAWDSDAPPSIRRLETLVNGEISRGEFKAIVEAMEAEIVCICELPETPSRPEIAISLGNDVLSRAAQEYPDVEARCGMGSPVSDLSNWRDSFRQAGQALEMARRLKKNRTMYFPDLSVNRLLLQLENHPELSAFKHEILGELLNYDNSEQLIQTLEVFFQYNGNHSQAAEALFIHRNTLIYRMERIAEITGMDLDNTETRLAVQLALHIHRMGDKV
jgi:purine catabolism regulator